MRLATILTPHGPRAAAQVGESFVDLHATDPGLPTCVKNLLAASPAIRAAARRAGGRSSAIAAITRAIAAIPAANRAALPPAVALPVAAAVT